MLRNSLCKVQKFRHLGKSGRTWRVTVAIVVAVSLFAFTAQIQAFKRGIHDDMTESVLRRAGFDLNSASWVGNANSFTDIYEPNTDAAHADNNKLAAASSRLRNKIQTIGNRLYNCNRLGALDALGEALHTVQDIYSHSNSVENGHVISDILNLVDGTAFCDSRQNYAPGGLVTGYFSVSGWFSFNQCRGIGPNDCCHSTLHKDDPGRNGYREARAAAEAATLNYLSLVEMDMRNRFGDAQATQFIKTLKRKQRTTMFVIDDTGSMVDEIEGVKATVNNILDRLIGSDEAPTLGLVTFKDNVNNRGLTCNIDALRAQINALSASGGGDCPEASNSALLSAIRTFPDPSPRAAGALLHQLLGGRILLATDASARDASLGRQVKGEAARRGISIDAILTGDCAAGGSLTRDSSGSTLSSNNTVSNNNPRDKARRTSILPQTHTGDPLTSPSAQTQLQALTEQTGGVLFNVTEIEVDDIVPTLLGLSDPDTTILLTRQTDPTPGTPLVVDIPVDDTFGEKITFMVTSSTASALPAFSLLRPNGVQVQPTDPDATRRELSSVVSYDMQAPAAGIWRVSLEGGERVVLRVFGASPFQFTGLQLLNPDLTPSRPEVESVPIQGDPVVGAQLVAEARFSSSPQEVSMVLRRPDGSLLQELSLLPIDEDRSFQANLTIPSEPFVIELKGLTPGGRQFTRQITVPVNPQVVEINATPQQFISAPGTTALIEVTVRNASATTATYRLEVSSSLGAWAWPVTIPPPFTLEAGASVKLPLSVKVLASAREDTRNDLTILVQDVATPTNENRASVAVVAGTPTDLGGMQGRSRERRGSGRSFTGLSKSTSSALSTTTATPSVSRFKVSSRKSRRPTRTAAMPHLKAVPALLPRGFVPNPRKRERVMFMPSALRRATERIAVARAKPKSARRI